MLFSNQQDYYKAKSLIALGYVFILFITVSRIVKSLIRVNYNHQFLATNKPIYYVLYF